MTVEKSDCVKLYRAETFDWEEWLWDAHWHRLTEAAMKFGLIDLESVKVLSVIVIRVSVRPAPLF